MKKQILIGMEFFDRIIEGDYFYIDKTLFIKELLENMGGVTLVNRPRRFGKTLNMSMLMCFFDISQDNKHLFDGLKIMEHTDIVEKHMNKYPVIFITLKDAGENNFSSFIENIKYLVSGIYRQNMFLYESEKVEAFLKKKFYRYYSEGATETELKYALIFLMECLYAYYGERVIVLVDEYDAPINNAMMEGYYQEAMRFMRGFLGSALKSNSFLEFGVLTGVQRISQESLVSGFNNPKVCGITDAVFTDCYGFTEEEVRQACEQYGYGDKFCDVKSWYDGYRFGDRDIYNPWSIVQFLSNGTLRNYWANTGGMSMLEDIFFKGSLSLKDDIAGLMTGIAVKMEYDEHITYPVEYKNDNAFWSLLLNAGYLKPCAGSMGVSFSAELVNREVKNIFARCIDLWFKRQHAAIHNTITEFVEFLLAGDADGVRKTLNEELLNNPSCYDFKEENSYHMFIFGILLAVSGDYSVLSNQESGKGRSDCVIKPDDKSKSAVIIEFKHIRDKPTDLKEAARKGLEQIDEKSYIYNLKKEGYERIISYSIAFHKKTCEVAMR